MATPKVAVSDHYITSQLGKGYTAGSMNVELTVDNSLKQSASKTLEVELLDPAGQLVAKKQQAVALTAKDAQKTVSIDFEGLNDLKLWSSEHPWLYTVIVRQLNNGGEEMVFSTKYGFRAVEKKGNLIYVNAGYPSALWSRHRREDDAARRGADEEGQRKHRAHIALSAPG